MSAPRQRRVQVLPKYPMGTLPGFGWLREAERPREEIPRAKMTPEKLAQHVALRKCVYFPAMVPAVRAAARVTTNPDLFRPPLRKRAAPPSTSNASPHARWDDPLSVGVLLALLPPIGFSLLWSSPRYTRDAKLAITALMLVFMTLACTAICTAILIIR